ncbi:hypothetical protein GA0074692_6760 [Micromonospora pallida]|uniref:TniQ protein n=1 Tax=Micromonospora pallida TaxID=145854 RepID=A0A1C6TN77_9ACTN|nr:hypothetical protein [Micromonospora pallida]SCL43198.1 hypothetical protein GA0074692_6760 [Micromonospora pallida]
MSDTLPVYKSGELPEGLATISMLRRMRRRPALGQSAVATLRYRPHNRYEYAPLYEIAAAQELPPLPPGRQAAFTAVRTCARCAATRDTPWPVSSHSDRRLCPGCVRAERLAAARPSWNRLRAGAVAWAREVLADPDSVLLALWRLDWGCPIELFAATLDGRVLVDVLVQPDSPRTGLARTPGAVDAADIVPYLMPLAGTRAVHIMTSGSLSGRFNWSDSPTDALARASRTWWHDPDLLGGPVIRQHRDDEFGQRWTDWHARTWSNGEGLWRGNHGRSGLADVPVPGPAESARALKNAMCGGLVYMALDKHPDGPPACPWLPPTGLTTCGADPGPDGLCPQHADDRRDAQGQRR